MDLKICPTCKTMVFADMDTCYGCMYRFGSDPMREEAVRRELEDSSFPENEEALQGGDGFQEGPAPLGIEQAVPWPPPIETERCAEKVEDEGRESADAAGAVMLETGAADAVAVFDVPPMTVSIRAGGSLPAGVTLQINIEPPRSEAALVSE